MTPISYQPVQPQDVDETCEWKKHDEKLWSIVNQQSISHIRLCPEDYDDCEFRRPAHLVPVTSKGAEAGEHTYECPICHKVTTYPEPQTVNTCCPGVAREAGETFPAVGIIPTAANATAASANASELGVEAAQEPISPALRLAVLEIVAEVIAGVHQRTQHITPELNCMADEIRDMLDSAALRLKERSEK